ncbi:MAG: hypothetical protein IKE75_04355 [Bacilli bacterium]|nr:hypothetical protein [Bacilli bacterium]
MNSSINLDDLSKKISQATQPLFEALRKEIYSFADSLMHDYNIDVGNMKNAFLDPDSIESLFITEFEEDFQVFSNLYELFEDKANLESVKSFNEQFMKDVIDLWGQRCKYIESVLMSRANKLSKFFQSTSGFLGSEAVEASEDVLSYGETVSNKINELVDQTISDIRVNLNEISFVDQKQGDIVQPALSEAQKRKEDDINLCYKIISETRRNAARDGITSKKLDEAISNFEQKIEEVKISDSEYNNELRTELDNFDKIWRSIVDEFYAERKHGRDQKQGDIVQPALSEARERYAEAKRKFDETIALAGKAPEILGEPEGLKGFEAQEAMILQADYLTDGQKRR